MAHWIFIQCAIIVVLVTRTLDQPIEAIQCGLAMTHRTVNRC
jgi:hypothetical protein